MESPNHEVRWTYGTQRATNRMSVEYTYIAHLGNFEGLQRQEPKKCDPPQTSEAGNQAAESAAEAPCAGYYAQGPRFPLSRLIACLQSTAFIQRLEYLVAILQCDDPKKLEWTFHEVLGSGFV